MRYNQKLRCQNLKQGLNKVTLNFSEKSNDVVVRRVDYSNADHMAALLDMLDAYASDPMGGGEPLSDQTRKNLPQILRSTPHATSFVAYISDQPVGLINGFETVSTFAAKPLINIHDLAVLASARGKGVASLLMQAMEQHAIDKGCCKLTLEVLTGNVSASRLYHHLGYRQYELDPNMGQAVFLQKKLA